MKLYLRSLPYGLAISSTAIALLLTLGLEPFLLRTIGAFFYIAIIVSAWYGGFRAGSFGVFLATLAIYYWFIPLPYQFWTERPEDIFQLVFFVLVAFLINLLTLHFRDSKHKIEQLSQQLTQENAELLRRAPSAAQMGMWEWNMATGKIKCSLDHEPLFGLAPGTFDGGYESFAACLHPEDKESVNQALQQAIQNNSLYQQEFRVVWADGSIHWIETRGHTFYDEAGQPIRMTGTVMAIDERKQAQGLLQQQFEQQRLVLEVTQRIRRSLNLQEILQTTVEEIRQLLKTDRVIIFQFSPNWSGTVVVESVGADWTAILSTEIYDPCIGEKYVEPYKQGLVTAKSDIYTAGIDPCHVQLLSNFQVRANLVVPIVKGDELWGLLITHHCGTPRQWQSSEIDLMRQLASQVSIAIQQAALFEQVQTELAERKQAEAALRESQLQIQRQLAEIETIYQSAPIGLNVLDTELRFVRINQRLAEMNGLPVEAHIGRTLRELLPDLADTAEQLLRLILETGEPLLNVEISGETPAQPGVQRIWLESFLPLKNGDRIVGISTVCEEITERKQAEQRLAKELLRIQTLFNTSFDGIVILDLQGNVLDANPRFSEMLGYTTEETTKLTIFDWDAQFTPEELRQLMSDYISLKSGVLETRHQRKDGSIYDVEISFNSLEWDGKILRFCVCRDISDRKQAEMDLVRMNASLEQRVQERTAELTQVNDRLLEALLALGESERSRRLALDLTHIACLDWHLPTHTQIWNDNHFTLLGLAPYQDEPSYELWRSHVHSDDIDWVEQRLLEAVENHTDYAAEYRVIHPDGSLHWLMARSRAIYDDSGQPVRVLGVLLDISDRKRAEKALQQYERIISNTKDGIALMNRHYIYQVANQGYLSWCNKSAHEVIGNSVRNILGEELFDNFIQPRLDRCLAGETIQYEKWFDYPNLVPQFMSVTYTPYQDTSENISGVVVSLRDLTRLKQAEQMLELQAVITRNMAEGICLIRADSSVIVYANPKFEQMFGYDCGELNGQHISIVNYPSEQVTAEEINQVIRSAILQNGEATYEVHNLKKDGTPFWCSATTSVFNHTDYGDVLVAVHQDITARKQAEAALQQQARQEQLLWNITQSIRQTLDLNAILNTTVTEVRQTLQVDRATVYRFNPDWSGDFVVESVSNDWIKLVESDIPKVWEDTYLQETQGGRFRNHESFVIADIYTAGLEPCHIELLEQFQAKAYAVAPIFSGEVLWGLLAIYQNATPRHWQSWEVELLQQITSQLSIAIQQSELYRQLQIELHERKQAAAVLREAERRWRSLLDNVQLIVVGLDKTGAINYVNPFFLSLTGYTQQEVLDKNWFENFLPLSSQQSIQTIFSEVLTNNPYPYYQNFILTKSGEERFIAWNNTMLQDSDGTPIGTISIGEDITERQKVEQMKNEFIGIVSHELRTPLTAIKMSLGLLKTGIYDKKPDKFQRMLEIAIIDTNRLVNLVNDILDLERLESGRAALEKTHCYAADLMKQAVNGVQPLASPQQITFTIAPTTAKVWAAEDAIIQTLTNVLSNAIKFSPPQSTITLSAESEMDVVLFQVSDRGRGIPADKLEAVFGRFQQVDASDARQKGGTGLGLAICRSIIEQHGGQIWVESTLGEGSSFFFTLPLPPEAGE